MIAQSDKSHRVELHVHTYASKDCLVRPKRLIQHCEKIGIDKIAITDHNAIEAAFEAQALAPNRVIVGEEIETTKGELIAYFMTEWVPPDLPPLEVIERLRGQGALISIPHPFDPIRAKDWSEESLLEITPHVDAIEVFNARCLNNAPNLKAVSFARQQALLATVGSDAHSLWEVGRATLVLPEFDDAASFKAALVQGEKHTKLSPAFVHLFSRYAVLVKRLQKLIRF